MRTITWDAVALEAARAWTPGDLPLSVSQDLRAELPALVFTDASQFDNDRRNWMHDEIARLFGAYGLRQRARAEQGNVVAVVFDFTLTDVDHFALRDELQRLLQGYAVGGPGVTGGVA
jgi:hypothetical protein